MSTERRFAAPPRVVVVTRATELALLLARHGTREQARFHLAQRDLRLEEVEAAHHRFEAVLAEVGKIIPLRFRRARIVREELSRFVFEPGDIIVAVGQDGLVANVAKYLTGQPVIGVNPDPRANAGVLVRHASERAEELLRRVADGSATLEARTMVEARLDDGQRLLALNEIFVGHRTHQSARYVISAPRAGARERQSSSGVVVATGTGATGWARSIVREREGEHALPAATDAWLAFFVREAFPSPATGTRVTEGRIEPSAPLSLRSEMNEGGVVFGDGIEDDRLAFGWGIGATVGVASERLTLVV